MSKIKVFGARTAGSDAIYNYIFRKNKKTSVEIITSPLFIDQAINEQETKVIILLPVLHTHDDYGGHYVSLNKERLQEIRNACESKNIQLLEVNGGLKNNKQRIDGAVIKTIQ